LRAGRRLVHKFPTNGPLRYKHNSRRTRRKRRAVLRVLRHHLAAGDHLLDSVVRNLAKTRALQGGSPFTRVTRFLCDPCVFAR
jgi:hypothetical protein